MANDRSEIDDPGANPADGLDVPRQRPPVAAPPSITIPSADPRADSQQLPASAESASQNEIVQQAGAIAAEREAARQRLVAQGQHSQRLLEEQQQQTNALKAELDNARSAFDEQLAAADAAHDELNAQLDQAAERITEVEQQLRDERIDAERRLTVELADQHEHLERRFTSQTRTFEAHVETLHAELDALRSQSLTVDELTVQLEQANQESAELSATISAQSLAFDDRLETEIAAHVQAARAEQDSLHRAEIDTLKAASEAELSAKVAQARDQERNKAEQAAERRSTEQTAALTADIEQQVKQQTLAIEMRTKAAELRSEHLSTQLEKVRAEHGEQVKAVARAESELERRLEEALEAQARHLTAEHDDALSKRQAQARADAQIALDKRSSELEELFSIELARQADELTAASRDRLTEQAANFEKVLNAELQAQSDQHESHLSTHEAFTREVAASTYDGAISESVARGRLEDLTGQATYLRSEVRRYRQLLEADRIEHTQQLLAAQEAADKSYGKAQVEFSAELQRYSAVNANALIAQQVDFDKALAEREQEHDVALERMHENYLQKVQAAQAHAEEQLAAAKQRFAHEIGDLKAANRHASTRRQRMAARDRSDRDDDLAHVQRQAAQAAGDQAAIEREHLLLSQRFEQLQLDRERQMTTLTADLERARQALTDERTKFAAERAEWLRKSAVLAAQADDMRRAQQVQLAKERADMQSRLDEAAVRYRGAITSAEERLLIAAAREADLEARVNRGVRVAPPPS